MQSALPIIMESLSINDLELLSWGIRKIYALSDASTFEMEALSIVHQLVPGDVPLFQTTNLRTHSVEMQFFLPVDQPRDGLSGGQVDLIRADLIQAEFILNHSSCSFTERDRLMLQLIRPHLSLAYGNVQRYQQLQQDLESLQRSIDHIGMVIIDRSGFIKQTTGKATSWLDEYFIKSTSRDRLPHRLWSWVAYQVANLTVGSDPVKAFRPLCIEQGTQKLVIRLVVAPDRNQYLLFLEEQTRLGLKSLELLGLSQRETEVLGLVMQGKDNKAIATNLGVGPSTIRKHLENIYRKFGVQSRTEAIAYALQQLGVLS
jgi:DNA-binding CsgD family transcriptional regulator